MYIYIYIYIYNINHIIITGDLPILMNQNEPRSDQKVAPGAMICRPPPWDGKPTQLRSPCRWFGTTPRCRRRGPSRRGATEPSTKGSGRMRNPGIAKPWSVVWMRRRVQNDAKSNKNPICFRFWLFQSFSLRFYIPTVGSERTPVTAAPDHRNIPKLMRCCTQIGQRCAWNCKTSAVLRMTVTRPWSIWNRWQRCRVWMKKRRLSAGLHIWPKLGGVSKWYIFFLSLTK